MMPKAAAVSLRSGPRGLQSPYGHQGVVALTAAIDLHLVVIGAYLLSAILTGPVAQIVRPPGISVWVEGMPEIPMTRDFPASRRGSSHAPQRGGQFKPVLAPIIPDDSLLAMDQPAPDLGLSGVDGPGGTSGDISSGLGDGPPDGSAAAAEPDTTVFEFVQIMPVPVKIVKPDYPEAATRLGLDGVVTVRVLVEKDGRTSRASVVRSTNDIFNERAEQAALGWVFQPGIMSAGPVRVWVAIPFRFALDR